MTTEPEGKTRNTSLERSGFASRSARRRSVAQGSSEKEDRKATKEHQTPTGFHDKAQGKRAARHPGSRDATNPNPNGVVYQSLAQVYLDFAGSTKNRIPRSGSRLGTRLSGTSTGKRNRRRACIKPRWGLGSADTAYPGWRATRLPWALSSNPVGVPEGEALLKPGRLHGNRLHADATVLSSILLAGFLVSDLRPRLFGAVTVSRDR